MEITKDFTCRACLQSFKLGTSIFCIFNENQLRFCDMMKIFTGINITEEEYPDKLCQSCEMEVPNVWKFVNMCQKSETFLQKYYEEQKIKLDQEDVVIKLELCDEGNILHLQNETSDREYTKSDLSDSDNKVYTNSPKSEPEEFLYSLKRKSKRAYKETKQRKSVKETKTDKQYSKRNRKSLTHNKWKCEWCEHVTESECRLKKHWKQRHPTEWSQLRYPCKECNKVFKRKNDLIVHGRCHSGEKPFACTQCNARFSQSGSLMLHSRRHTGETPFRCPACPRSFSSVGSLRRHGRVHSGERPYSCESCGAQFPHASSLRQHAAVHSNARPHRCQLCPRALKSRLALRNHMLTHGERGFVCENCGKNFFVKANLDKHMKKMHNDKAGVCPICAKPCSDLESHATRHSQEPRFSCALCPRSFTQKGSLKFHLTQHANADKYKCDVTGCTKAFPKRNMLEFHVLKIHCNETPFVCKYCSNGFYRISDLSRHINTFHPNEKNSGK